MNEKRKTIKTFVIPARSIKAKGNFRQLIQKLSISDSEKQEIIGSYQDDGFGE